MFKYVETIITNIIQVHQNHVLKEDLRHITIKPKNIWIITI